jgi:hypothetical protein
MTAGVYGLVAGIVKLDDAGMHLVERSRQGGAAFYGALGGTILRAAPWLMKGLGIAGTIAMFLVGGGIVTHAIPGLHDLVRHQAEALRSLSVVGPVLAALLPTLVDFVCGIVAGALTLVAWNTLQRLRGKSSH